MLLRRHQRFQPVMRFKILGTASLLHRNHLEQVPSYPF